MALAGQSEIRRAGAQDAVSICTLHVALCAEIYPEKGEPWILSPEGTSYLARRLAGEGLALVATVDGRPIGYLMAGPRVSADGVNAAGLESMYVVPEFRRQAVGLALVKEFLRWFNGTGLERASVAVQPENVAAHRLYQKAGFSDHALIENGCTLILRIERAEIP